MRLRPHFASTVMKRCTIGVVVDLYSEYNLVYLNMKIQYSALVGSTSGKLNGSVASHNKGGAYIRNKGVVSNPNTAGQSIARSRFGGSSSSWKLLTQSQRDAWIAEAPFWPYQDKLQQTRIPSGFQLYTQINTVRAGMSLAPLLVPPTKVDMPGLNTLVLTLLIDNDPTPGTLVFDSEVYFNNETQDANYVLQVAFTPGVSAGIQNPNTAYRLSPDWVPVPASTIGVLAISESVYTSAFETPLVGQKVFMRARVVYELSGQVGPWVNTSTIVTLAP